jgi:hypothetical protein
LGLISTLKKVGGKIPGVAVAKNLYDQATGSDEYAPVSTAGLDQAADEARRIREGNQIDAYNAYKFRGPAPTMTAASIQAAAMDPASMRAATIATGPQAEFRGGQTALVSDLQNVLAGKTPSVAETQLARTVGRNIAGQQSLAASARGPNMALARRTAAMNVGQLNAQAGADAALLRAQEQAGARAQLGDVLATGRGADVGLATSQAGLEQQAAAENAGFQQQASGQNAGFRQQASATNAGFQQDASGRNLGSALDTRKTNVGEDAGFRQDILRAQELAGNAEAAKFQAEKGNQQQQQAANAGIVNTLATVGSVLSDRRSKRDVEPEPRAEIAAFLRAIKPSAFEYKDDSAGAERHGVIAQDLARSKIGRSLVVDTPKGKAVAVPAAVGAMLAAMSDLNRRLDRMEAR